LPAVSARKREQHLDWWVKRFGGRTLAEITPDLVAEARDALAAEKFTRGRSREVKGVTVPPAEYARSGATVNRYLATLSAMLTVAAKEWRLLDRNPVSDVSKKKAARGRIRFLSDSERDALLKACSASPWPAPRRRANRSGHATPTNMRRDNFAPKQHVLPLHPYRQRATQARKLTIVYH
jgi:integrase